MLRKLVSTTAKALVLSLGLVSAASAATVFNLGVANTNTSAASYGYTQDAITVTATGLRRDGCALFCLRAEDVSRNGQGLGVFGGFPDSRELDGQIDEALTFTFDQAVRLISVSFSFIDSNDAYDVFVGTGTGLTQVANDSLTNPFNFVGNVVNNVLTIYVDGNASAFRVESLTVAAIPLPAAGWLMLAGLGGLALARRRRA